MAEAYPSPPPPAAGLAALEAELVCCRRCPRLVEWRERVAAEPRAAFRGQRYWGRPVPGFGDPRARVLLYGLAPAAHGANRTGRMFTGDRSGEFLYAALHRTGFANRPTSERRGDGLQLRSLYIAAAVRCAPPANRPTPAERDNCREWSARELELLPALKVAVCLGGFAWQAFLGLLRSRGIAARGRFGHGAELALGRLTVVGCYHPSQQNTFTGRLTAPMLEGVLVRARELAGLGRPG